MAVAGGMTTAYEVTMRGGVLVVDKITRPMSQCQTVDEAAAAVQAGGTAIVAGSDAYALRQRLTTNGGR